MNDTEFETPVIFTWADRESSSWWLAAFIFLSFLLHSAAFNYCAYTDFTADVFATQGNCGLLGTEDNRKIGLYPAGNFSLTPPQP